MTGEGGEVPAAVQSRPSRDVDLARRAAGGDPAAQRGLAERVFTMVVDTVRYLSAGHPDADDFVQLSLTEILRSAGTYSGLGHLEGWARRITVRTTMRALRKHRGRAAVMTLVPDFHTEIDGRHEGLETRIALRARLATLLGRLTPERRAAVVLRLVEGLSIDEIAEETDTARNTVRFRLRTALAQLRSLIVRDPVLREWHKANP